MKIITCSFLPKRYAYSLFGYILVKGRSWVDKEIVNHETIHYAQQKELGFILFFVLYFLEFVVKFLCYKSFNKTYMSLCFEKEAYANAKNHNYLKTRKHFCEFYRQYL